MEKETTISTTMPVPTIEISSRKKKKASVYGAMLDASGGNSGKRESHFTKNCQSTGLMKCIVNFIRSRFSSLEPAWLSPAFGHAGTSKLSSRPDRAQ